MKPQEVANSLYGLQRLGDSWPLRELFSALTTKVQQCRGMLRARQVAQALYGLQNAGDTPEVRQLVAALSVKVNWVTNKSFEISKFKFNISESSNLRTSQGSFSAVSKPNFASKYSLESSLRDLHNALLCIVLESNPQKPGKPWGAKILVQSREKFKQARRSS